jgi:hypothetical protein
MLTLGKIVAGLVGGVVGMGLAVLILRWWWPNGPSEVLLAGPPVVGCLSLYGILRWMRMRRLWLVAGIEGACLLAIWVAVLWFAGQVLGVLVPLGEALVPKIP